jgi:hypothetical protein
VLAREEWRVETPGHDGWVRTARRELPNKFFILSADCHAQEPGDWVTSRIDPAYSDRLPRLEVNEEGVPFIITEGNRPWKIQKTDYEGEDKERNLAGRTPEERIADQERDGVDIEVVFPNKGMHGFGTADLDFSLAMCRAWNDWVNDDYGPYRDRILPMAMVPTADVEAAITELQRVAALGFKGITISCKSHGSRLTTNVVGCAPEEVGIDMRVQVAYEDLDDENGTMLPVFRPVDEQAR